MRSSDRGVGASADSPETPKAPPVLWTAAAVYAGAYLGATEPSVAAGCAVALILAVGVVVATSLVQPTRLRASLQRVSLGIVLASAAALHGAHALGDATRADGAHVGRWSALGSFGEDELGELSGARTRYVIPAGAIADGELVAVVSHEPVAAPARGPVAGPNAVRGILPPVLLHADEIVRLAPPPRTIGAPIASALADLRRACIDRALALRDRLTGSLLAALLFGDTRSLPDGVPDLFVRTGTYHVLAISGLQVALVAMLVVWPLGAFASAILRALSLGRWRPGPLAPRLFLLALFVPLAGAGAPVVRSAIAWGLGELAPRVRSGRPFARDAGGHPIAMGRRANSIALWSLALILECAAHPESVASLSVQLSYAATAGLIVGTSPIAGFARSLCPSRARIDAVDALGRARSPLWRIPLQRAIDGAITALSASAAAVLATLPFTWSRFGEWSPIGIVATALLVLPVLWMLVAGWAWIAAPALVPELCLEIPARATVRMLEIFDRVPGSPDLLPHRPGWLIGAAVLATFAVLRGGRSARLFGRAAGLAWAAIAVPWTAAPRGLELWALDVGSGTAVVWRAPGSGAWLFDAGSRDRPDVAREAVLPLLREWEAARLTIVLSHADRDHDGALPHLASRMAPRLWMGALPAHCAERLPHTTAHVDVRTGAVGTGASTGMAVSLERGLAREDNEGSRSVRIAYGGEEIVLCGDAEAEGLRAWLANLPRSPALRLLLLPHHGSESALLGPLLAATRPREVWVSGPRAIPIAAELDRRDLAWRWTARDGPLRLELDSLRLPNLATPAEP